MRETEFSEFKNIIDRQPKKITLLEFIDQLKQQKPAVTKLRSMPDTAPTEHEARQKFKVESLKCYTISSICIGGHAAGNVVKHSGLACIDLDKKDNMNVQDFDNLKEIIKALPFVLLCALSCGGQGYFVIVRLETPEKHGEQYDALVRYFEAAGLKCDTQCKDVNRMRYETYDPAPYYNPDAVPFVYTIKQDAEQKAEDATPVQPANCIDAIKVWECLKEAKANNIALSDDRDIWMRVAFAFAGAFGEHGRALFYLFSALSDKYGGVEEMYDDALKNGRGEITLGTFFKLCSDHGITTADFDSKIKCVKAAADFSINN